MDKRWRIFRYSGPSEHVGIAWAYSGVLDALTFLDRAKEARALSDSLNMRAESGEIDGEKVEFRLKPAGTMGGKIIVIWEE